MDLKIKNKRALVLGASAGIGKAVAQALVQEGAQVMIASRSETRLQQTAQSLHAACITVCDLSQAGSAAQAIQSAQRKLGGLDILVCNTGGPPKAKTEDVTDSQWREGFQSIFMSVVEAVNAALPGMRQGGWGRILLVSSTSAREPLPAMAISNSMRAALAGLVRTLSDEVAGSGITINTLLPGYINTDRLRDLGVTQEKVAAVVPAGRMGEPAELAAVAAFLASEQASYVCGQAIAVDGGRLRGL